MIQYQRNNILFRIASSGAISKFKAEQAHSFIQVARKEIDFGEAPRELVLLEYDRISHWIFRIERLCQAAPEGPMPHMLRTSILDSLREEFRTIEDVIEAHSDVFDTLLRDYAKMFHRYSVKMLFNRVHGTDNYDIHKMFPIIVEIVSLYLQHLLIALHEFNNNVCAEKPPFLSIMRFATDGFEGNDRFLPVFKRAEFFVKLGIGHKYLFKNYTDIDLTDDITSYFHKQCGITLVPEVSHASAERADA